MCTWLHVYVATCINVYKGTGIWREFLHASPNNPKCQGKRQGYSHVCAIALTHQLATFRASSSSPVGVPPIVHERLCHHVLACVLIPLAKIE